MRPITRITRQLGFSIIEAMVAMLIMTFGLMAVSGMQMTLSQGGDVSKQRTEATRLAQEKMEALRSYTQITTATGVISWNGLSSSSDTTTTNTTFTRTWTIGGASADTHRAVAVNVSWLDRTGGTQGVTLTSVISQTDPANVAFLSFPLPENTTLKRVKNRSLDIPIPAISLAGDNAGSSAYKVSSNLSVIFSDSTGSVVKSCGFEITSTTANLSSCTTVTAVVLAGYITDNSSTSTQVCTGNGRNRVCVTTNLTGVSGMDTSGITWSDNTSRTITCVVDVATDQNTTTTTVISGYKYYLCVIPIATNGAWAGSVKLKGIPKTSTYVGCRYQYTSTTLGNNGRNVQPYVLVGDSLDNQNYLVNVSSSNNSAACPAISDSFQAAAASLIVHQDCRSSLNTSTLNANCPQ